MPPKHQPQSKAAAPTLTYSPNETIAARTAHRTTLTNPSAVQLSSPSQLPTLTPAQRKTWAHTNLIIPVSQDRIPLSNKAEREFWKTVAKEQLPIRRLSTKGYNWGTDRNGRDLGDYTVKELEERSLRQAKLTGLRLRSRHFKVERDHARRQGKELEESKIEEEKARRKEMAQLNKELYGEVTGSLAQDPEWDDVIPIPQNEPEDALAKIAYPDDYAEAVSYLRAVMLSEECSPRTLRLTAHIISMNPAHYTVWLFRFKILKTLALPVPDEIEWLNEVALSNLKNYQIWHHRQLLMDYYYPTVEFDMDATKKLGKSEVAFIQRILREDTKNYHVWSYRQYIVEKLGLWSVNELASTQNMIEDDVRNNSAWSHRFFLVFSNPDYTTPDLPPTKHDEKVPADIIERELKYARQKIELAPQNQSPWNYLRGVLAKSGRGLAGEMEFAGQFVADEEDVKSSHALDLLADAHVEKGEKEEAKTLWKRLAEKWDPVREGYWNWRIREVEKA